MGVYDLFNRAADWRELRVRGLLPAAFLNGCVRGGVELLSAVSEDAYTLRVRLRKRDVQRAVRIAQRTDCTVEPCAAGGAGHALRRLRRRGFAALGLLLAVAALFWSRIYIWEIEVIGTETVSEGRILDALAECGVGIGSCWLGITSDNLRSELLERTPELGWATVNIYGSRAEVLVRERIPKPAIWKPEEPVELLARRSGYVTKVTALNGTARVQPGMAVDTGEVLIAGETQSAFGGTRQLHAAGTVTAETYYELRAATPLRRTQKTPAGAARNRWAIVVGKNRLNLYRNSSISGENCDMISTVWTLSVPGLFTLPLRLVRETETAWTPTETELDCNLARQGMEAELHERLLRELGAEGVICTEEYSAVRADGSFTVVLRATCIENIAVEAPIKLEE